RADDLEHVRRSARHGPALHRRRARAHVLALAIVLVRAAARRDAFDLHRRAACARVRVDRDDRRGALVHGRTGTRWRDGASADRDAHGHRHRERCRDRRRRLGDQYDGHARVRSPAAVARQSVTAPADHISARRFLTSFMLLSVVSGLAIGMGRIVTTFYVIGLGAGAGAIGAIGAAEALGKMVVTVPAGFLIYRLGARRVYSTATIGSMLITALTPFMKVWAGVALM